MAHGVQVLIEVEKLTKAYARASRSTEVTTDSAIALVKVVSSTVIKDRPGMTVEKRADGFAYMLFDEAILSKSLPAALIRKAEQRAEFKRVQLGRLDRQAREVVGKVLHTYAETIIVFFESRCSPPIRYSFPIDGGIPSSRCVHDWVSNQPEPVKTAYSAAFKQYAAEVSQLLNESQLSAFRQAIANSRTHLTNIRLGVIKPGAEKQLKPKKPKKPKKAKNPKKSQKKKQANK